MVVKMRRYNKICAICGKSFVSLGNTCKYCSQDCSKIAARRRYDPKPKLCPTCGKELYDRRQKWCLNCLLDDYEQTHSPISYHRLQNRGYDIESIIEELKNRK